MLRKNTNNSKRITIPFFSFGRCSFCFRSISFHPKHLDVRRAHCTDEENTDGAFTVSCTQNHIHQFKLLVAFAQLHSGTVVLSLPCSAEHPLHFWGNPGVSTFFPQTNPDISDWQSLSQLCPWCF